MIGVICFWDRVAVPYLAKYEKILKESGSDYEIVVWDRNPEFETPKVTVSGNEVTIGLKCEGPFIKKIFSFLKWTKTIKKLIKERKYDRLVILSTLPGLLLSPMLIGEFKDKYIFDIRDYTAEDNPLFKAYVLKIVKSSVITAISSPKFKSWLADLPNIMVNHNITVDSRKDFTLPNLKRDKIRLVNAGNVRLNAEPRQMMITLKDNDRIEQHFYGRIIPGSGIMELAEEKGIKNAFFHGPFDTSEKEEIYKNVDLVNIVSADHKPDGQMITRDATQLANRLYDALLFYRPIVASKGSYLGDLVVREGVGCAVNGLDENVFEEIEKYVESFEPQRFKENCDKLLNRFFEEENLFKQEVKMVLEKWQ